MTPEQIAFVQEVGALIGTTGGAAWIAWRARGRREIATPFSPDHDSQPRVISRKEWHDVVDLVQGIPAISARARRNEARINALEREFSEHLKATQAAMGAFTRLEANFQSHVERWEEVGVEAREHRQRLEAHLLRLEQKVDRRGEH